MSFIWIVWSTLYVYFWTQAQKSHAFVRWNKKFLPLCIQGRHYQIVLGKSKASFVVAGFFWFYFLMLFLTLVFFVIFWRYFLHYFFTLFFDVIFWRNFLTVLWHYILMLFFDVTFIHYFLMLLLNIVFWHYVLTFFDFILWHYLLTLFFDVENFVKTSVWLSN